MPQQSSYDWAIQNLVLGFYPDILCLIAQLLITLRVSYYNIIYRNKYPMKQNSPLLTVLCLVTTFTRSLLAVITRNAVSDDFNKYDVNARCCFLTEDYSYHNLVSIMSYMNLFLSEFPMMAYALKLLRNIVAYFQFLFKRKWIVSLFSSQLKLLAVCLIYCGLIVGADMYARFRTSCGQSTKDGISCAQMYEFFCNSPHDKDAQYLIKYTITGIIFFSLYTTTHKLSPKLKFGNQWFIFLLIVMVRLVNHDLLIIFDYQSTVRPNYYVLLITNLLFIASIAYFLGAKDPEVAAIPNSDSTLEKLEEFVDQTDIMFSVEQFFKTEQKHDLFIAYRKVKIQMKQKEYGKSKLLKTVIEEDLKQYLNSQENETFDNELIKQIRENGYKAESYDRNFTEFRQRLERVCDRIFEKMIGTKAYERRRQLIEQNKEYVENMHALGISIES